MAYRRPGLLSSPGGRAASLFSRIRATWPPPPEARASTADPGASHSIRHIPRSEAPGPSGSPLQAADRMPDPATAGSYVFYRKLTRRVPPDRPRRGVLSLRRHGPPVSRRLRRRVRRQRRTRRDRDRRRNGASGAHARVRQRRLHDPRAVEELAAELARGVAWRPDLVYPLSSGSDAVEAALKLARQYWVETGRPRKHKIIALSPAYHGNTLLALSASARDALQTSFQRVDAGHRSGTRRPTRIDARAGASLRSARRAAARHSRTRSRERDRRGWRRSSPSRSADRPRARRCPRPNTSRASARSAIGTGCCSSPTKCWWAPAAPARGRLSSPTAWCRYHGARQGHRGRIRAPLRRGRAASGSSRQWPAARARSITRRRSPITRCSARPGWRRSRYLRAHRLVERCAEMGRVLHAACARCAASRRSAMCGGEGCWRASSSSRTWRPGSPCRERAIRRAVHRAALDAGLIVWPNVGPRGRKERRSGDARAAVHRDRGTDRRDAGAVDPGAATRGRPGGSDEMTTATKITYTSAAGDLDEFHRRFDAALAGSARRGSNLPNLIGGEPVPGRGRANRRPIADRHLAAARPLCRCRAGGGRPRGAAARKERSVTGRGIPGRNGSRSCGGPPS